MRAVKASGVPTSDLFFLIFAADEGANVCACVCCLCYTSSHSTIKAIRAHRDHAVVV